MHITVYRPEDGGVPFKSLEGLSLEEASQFVLEEYDEDYLCIETSRRIDGAIERLDLTAAPIGIVAFTPDKTPEQLQAEIVVATQRRLDAFAQTRGYDSILSAATYATSTIPQFQAEGQYAVNVRDLTWSCLYQMLAEVQAQTKTMPAGFADIENGLPELVWPDG